MEKLAILGASGHGKVVADIALSCGWQQIIFFDDAWPECRINGVWQVEGNIDTLLSRLAEFNGVIVGIGDNQTRLEKTKFLQLKGANLTTLIHPSAVVSSFSSLGLGSVVMPQAAINIDSKLGLACIINTGATVDHDCILEDGVHLSPGANLAGGVRVQENSWLGIGSAVCPGVSIGVNVIVGAGAVVIRELASDLTVVGVPARTLHEEYIEKE